MRENFESPQVSWRFAASDAPYRVQQHQRAQTQSHWGHGSEQLRLACGTGTHVYYGHDIGRPRVIDELLASVWVKADRPGVQFLARVVYPRAVDPSTGQPVTALIQGSTYVRAGAWERLALENIPRLVAEQARVLRLQLRRDVDDREAYLDLVLLNVYCGAGVVDLYVDDLEIEGHLQVKDAPAPWRNHDMNEAPNVAPAQFQPPVEQAQTEQEVELRGAVMLLGGRPFFPRIIEHRGESFEFLKRLGFNTVRLAAHPTPWQVTEARRNDVWLVGPPPDVRAGRGIGPMHDRVLAWDLGGGLGATQLAEARDLAFAVRRADEQAGRPILACADEQLRSYSRIANVMLLKRAPLGSSFNLSQYGDWLQARSQLLRPGTPAWASIQTQLPSPAPHTPPDNADPQQLRLLAMSAVASGARGLVFTSRSRLDGEDEQSLKRAQALELVNRELDLIEPWLAICNHASPLQLVEPGVRAAMFNSQHSQLILLSQIGEQAQHVVGPPGATKLSLVVPGVPESSDAYMLTPTGLRPLAHRRVTGGIGVALDELEWVSAVVFTTDPLVYARLSQTAARNRNRVAQLQLGATADLLQETTPALAARAGSPRASGAAATSLALIEANLSQGQRMLSAGDAQAASTYAHRAAVSLAQMRRGVWEESTRSAASLRSPLEMSFAALTSAEREPGSPVNDGRNQIAGGNMEDIAQLTRNGWRNFRREQHGISSKVELSPVRPNTGQFSLRLEATRSGQQATAHVESPPVWVRTPSVTLQPGQPYIVQGWIRVDAPPAGTLDGVLIHDSVQGRALAIRAHQTDGWKPFALRGIASHNQPLSLNIELTGLGEAFIDDIEIILPQADAPESPAQPTKPAANITRLRDLIRLPR